MKTPFFTPRRWLTHFVLALFSVGGYLLAGRYAPKGSPDYLLTIGMGYVSLALISLSLIIGPLMLLRQRQNPVNLMLRRDVGIWAGITGLIHVFFGLFLNARGDLLTNFLRWTEDGYRILTSLRGITNDIGLIATLILLALLLTSNNLMLRRLKGKPWKALQRWNYVLFGLVLLHTFTYQRVSIRESYFRSGTLLLMLGALIVQAVGIQLYRQRKNPAAGWRKIHPQDSAT